MGKLTILVLRIVIAVAMLGSVAVQALIVPLLWLDLGENELWGRSFLVSLVVLGGSWRPCSHRDRSLPVSWR